MTIPLKVYLDSSDFSVLSNPELLSTPGLIDLRAQLFKWKSAHEVEFVYSVVHVLEAAAVEAQHTEKAKERAQLIYELCGKNVFDTFLEILRREGLVS